MKTYGKLEPFRRFLEDIERDLFSWYCNYGAGSVEGTRHLRFEQFWKESTLAQVILARTSNLLCGVGRYQTMRALDLKKAIWFFNIPEVSWLPPYTGGTFSAKSFLIRWRKHEQRKA